MTDIRHLIVNADDFGQSAGVNQGIIQAHEHGILTSASLMVRWPAAAEAAEYGRRHTNLGVGLHLDLGEWAYRDDEWVQVYEVVPSDNPSMVREEVQRQLDEFRRLLGRDPTHLDSHQHVHREEPVRAVAEQIARQLGVPLRECSPDVRYRGDFYGQTGEGAALPEAISVEAMIHILDTLEVGVTELGCHPAATPDLDTMYRDERVQELRVLCDPGVQRALDARGIRLLSFGQLNVSRETT
jgi:predicted glycoside hydrolase/deacetylase ChbG (UPF0249 family)